MFTTLKGGLAALSTTALLATSPLLLAPSTADAAAPLTCHASMSDSTPNQYSNVYVHVKTASHAQVHTVAHYRTTTTGHSKTANSHGKASIEYYISSATAGYRVNVTVTVTKDHHSKTCSTGFTPHS